jgi:hypothetical protein
MPVVAEYMKMDPPPDVDKAAHGHAGTNSCWLATAANMLAGAGYGVGVTVQQRADNIYNQLAAHYGVANGGWADYRHQLVARLGTQYLARKSLRCRHRVRQQNPRALE